MSSLNVIGLLGPMGCGKTTAANILVARHGFVRIRVADTLKRMLMAMGLSKDQVDGDLKEVPCDLLGGKTPRYAMQTLGSEWGRDIIDNDLWVRTTKFHIQSALADDRSVVIDDIRFPDEANMVRELGGSLYRILRSESEKKPMHRSEEAWRDVKVDGVLSNEFDFTNLQMQVAQLFNLTIIDWMPNEQ